MPSLPPAGLLSKPARTRSSKLHAVVYDFPTDLLEAVAEIDQADAALTHAEHLLGQPQIDAFQRYRAAALAAEGKLRDVATTSPPGVRRRCDEQVERLDLLRARAAEVVNSHRPPAEVIDLATRRACRQLVQMAAEQSVRLP